VLVAAACCPAPPLLDRQLTGADPVLPELRQACLDAVTALVRAEPEVIAVIAAASERRSWDPAGRLDRGAFAPALSRPAPGQQAPGQPGDPAERLPVPLGLAGLLLDQAGYDGRRELHSVTRDDPADQCAALGAQLAVRHERVGLLVMADGSARRTLKAPGYLDERSVPFDLAVESAIRAGDLAALLTLDAGLARELMAAGRPAWQVLAGAAQGLRADCAIGYCDAPFGVSYLVATVRCASRS
jgi:hypothetical protein